MSAHTNLVFCADADRDRVNEAKFGVGGFYGLWFANDPIDLRGETLILLAVGPEGGAALARWVAEHGLDGVRGIGLVGVTAPWAIRVRLSGRACGQMVPGPRDYTPLGPLEPLRAVAERALIAPRCENWSQEEFAAQTGENGTCSNIAEFMRIVPHGEARLGPDKPFCAKHARRWKARFLVPIERLRLVIACAPDDGVCACGGTRDHEYERVYGTCGLCSGSGRALSSARIAEELIGVPVERTRIGNTHPQVFANGGNSAILFPTRAALDEHGLRAVVERLIA